MHIAEPNAGESHIKTVHRRGTGDGVYVVILIVIVRVIVLIEPLMRTGGEAIVTVSIAHTVVDGA